MTVTTICRVFFHWYEFEALIKFEAENPNFKKIAEDTTGTYYECRTYSAVDLEERRKDNG